MKTNADVPLNTAADIFKAAGGYGDLSDGAYTKAQRDSGEYFTYRKECHEKIASTFGVDPTRVNRLANPNTDTLIPAAWYPVLCDMTWRKLDKRLFTFKGVDK